jgi:hypothetical protein
VNTTSPDGFPTDPMQQLELGVARGPAFPPLGTPLIAAAPGARRGAFDGHPASGARFASVVELRAAAGGGLLSSVMIGRAAYTTPWMLADADRLIFGQRNPGLSRREVIAAYVAYATQQLPAEVPADERAALPSIYATHVVMRPLLNLFHGCDGGARFHRRDDDPVVDDGQASHVRGAGDGRVRRGHVQEVDGVRRVVRQNVEILVSFLLTVGRRRWQLREVGSDLACQLRFREETHDVCVVSVGFVLPVLRVP